MKKPLNYFIKKDYTLTIAINKTRNLQTIHPDKSKLRLLETRLKDRWSTNILNFTKNCEL
jgi:hypothetical protein